MNKILPQEINTVTMSYHLYDLKTRGPLTELTPKTTNPKLSSFENKTVGLSLSLAINGEDVKGYIDPLILIDYLNDYTDEDNDYSDFYVISCSCGVPGCNGIHDGIYITVVGEEISWKIPKDMGYSKSSFVEDAVYRFNKKKYVSCFNSTKNAIKKALKEYELSKETVEISNSMSWKDLMDHEKKLKKGE